MMQRRHRLSLDTFEVYLRISIGIQFSKGNSIDFSIIRG